jgi:hypothetical protein
VWVNGKLAVQHEGGYTPFCADITDLLVEGDKQTVVVRALDDPLDLAKPRGKQDWKVEPHSIWYIPHQRHLAERVDGARARIAHRPSALELLDGGVADQPARPHRWTDAPGLKLRVRLSARGERWPTMSTWSSGTRSRGRSP